MAPYINNDIKCRLKKDNTPKSAGEVTYEITLELIKATKNWNKPKIILVNNVGQAKNNEVAYPANKIAIICKNYLEDNEIRFERLNACIGAIINATFEYIRRNPFRMPFKLLDRLGKITYDFAAEWYARNLSFYENEAIKRNGDVYPIIDAEGEENVEKED